MAQGPGAIGSSEGAVATSRAELTQSAQTWYGPRGRRAMGNLAHLTSPNLFLTQSAAEKGPELTLPPPSGTLHT